MSKTDKTAPIRVKMLDSFTVHHNHSQGSCTLPDSPLDDSDYLGCYYEPRYHDPIFNCGCGMCGDDWDGGPSRRRRREEKKFLRKWEDEY